MHLYPFNNFLAIDDVPRFGNYKVYKSTSVKPDQKGFNLLLKTVTPSGALLIPSSMKVATLPPPNALVTSAHTPHVSLSLMASTAPATVTQVFFPDRSQQVLLNIFVVMV